MVKAVESGSIKKGEKTVVVMRYLGPKGGPGECDFIIEKWGCWTGARSKLIWCFVRDAGDVEAH
jgi:Dehydratase family